MNVKYSGNLTMDHLVSYNYICFVGGTGMVYLRHNNTIPEFLKHPFPL
jgi:hypothetical protein